MFARFASRTRLAAVAAVFSAIVSAGSARADTINFTGQTANQTSGPSGTPINDGVSFSGSMTLTFTGTTTATLSITLKNTTSTTYPGSDAVKYGYITGFGFNVPNNVTASAAKTGNFSLLSAATSATSLQGGAFDYAFSTGSQLHTVSGTQIPLGLAAGQSATFVVSLSGSGVAGLTAAQIIAEKSAPSNTTTQAGKVPFSVRFRSTNTGFYQGEYQGTAPPDGDKVPVSSVTTPTPPSGVPAPPGAVLAGIGFGSLLLGRLRRKK